MAIIERLQPVQSQLNECNRCLKIATDERNSISVRLKNTMNELKNYDEQIEGLRIELETQIKEKQALSKELNARAAEVSFFCSSKRSWKAFKVK